jgi:hypothetical protein
MTEKFHRCLPRLCGVMVTNRRANNKAESKSLDDLAREARERELWALIDDGFLQ